MRKLLRGLVIGGVVLCGMPAVLAAQPASFVYPTDGATDVTLSTPFQWTAVPGASVYYLYVGTTRGANDLVNTGEIAATSRDLSSVSMPIDRTLFATIWTKLDGQWLGREISFVLRPYATFVYPLANATGVSSANDFRWTRVPGAIYYLYVGSVPGAKDIVDSGEITATGLAVPPLPPSTTLYARIYTKAGGVWRVQEISFQTSDRAEWIFPRSGAANIALPQSFRWTAVPGADAYYLYVGTQRGARDLVDTGEITATSYMPPALPTDRPLFARIWTKIAGQWLFRDSTFLGSCSVCFLGAGPPSAPPATLAIPSEGQEIRGDVGTRFKWHPVAGADGYRLWIGLTAGASDVFDSGVIAQTDLPEASVGVPLALPRGRVLYVTLQTFFQGTSYESSSTFRTETSAVLTYPAPGSVVTDRSQPFTWTAVPGAVTYYLYVGTSPGAKDVVDTGELPPTTTSVAMPAAMEGGRTFYATMWTKIDGQWKFTSVVFSTAPVAVLLTPGGASVASPATFTWTAVSGASAYYLYVGTAPGAKNVVDSGETPNRQFGPVSLSAGTTYYATIWTKAGGVWRSSSIVFTTAP